MEEEKCTRQVKGIFIPIEIWENDELSLIEKVVLMEIDSLDDGIKGCYASNKYLAEFCKCAESTIRSAISHLKRLEYIKQTSFNGRKRTIKSNIKAPILMNSKDRPLKFSGQTAKICRADCQNLAHSNIEDNSSIYKKSSSSKEDNDEDNISKEYNFYKTLIIDWVNAEENKANQINILNHGIANTIENIFNNLPSVIKINNCKVSRENIVRTISDKRNYEYEQWQDIVTSIQQDKTIRNRRNYIITSLYNM